MLTSTPEVEFRKDTHQYFRQGKEYLSQSSFVKIFEPLFDKRIVHMSAKKEGVTSDVMQAEWDKKRDDASDFGNEIHCVLEDSWLGKKVEGKYQYMVDQVRTLVKPSRTVFPEKILYLDDHLLAGTTDLPSERDVSKGHQLLDIFDYKTNISKGVTLYSGRFKDGKWNRYANDRFLAPIDHLEHTLYNKYCLQLSLYMYMAEMSYHVIPGRMGLLNIDLEFNVRLLAVPYMKYEIMAMLESYKELKII